MDKTDLDQIVIAQLLMQASEGVMSVAMELASLYAQPGSSGTQRAPFGRPARAAASWRPRVSGGR